MRVRTCGAAVLAVALAAVAGCGGKLSKVEGVVTLEGKPVDGASVMLYPVEGKGQLATGQTDANGVFTVLTPNAGNGALPGDYKVVVQLNPRIEAEPPTPGDVGAVMAMMKKAQEEARKKHRHLPDVYAKDSTTPLRCTVPHAGKLVLDLKGNVVVK